MIHLRTGSQRCADKAGANVSEPATSQHMSRGILYMRVPCSFVKLASDMPVKSALQ